MEAKSIVASQFRISFSWRVISDALGAGPLLFFKAFHCLFISYSSIAILGVLHSHDDLGADGALILEICDLIKEIAVLSIQHMKRPANETVHCLAQHALMCKSDVDWSSSNISVWYNQ